MEKVVEIMKEKTDFENKNNLIFLKKVFNSNEVGIKIVQKLNNFKLENDSRLIIEDNEKDEFRNGGKGGEKDREVGWAKDGGKESSMKRSVSLKVRTSVRAYNDDENENENENDVGCVEDDNGDDSDDDENVLNCQEVRIENEKENEKEKEEIEIRREKGENDTSDVEIRTEAVSAFESERGSERGRERGREGGDGKKAFAGLDISEDEGDGGIDDVLESDELKKEEEEEEEEKGRGAVEEVEVQYRMGGRERKSFDGTMIGVIVKKSRDEADKDEIETETGKGGGRGGGREEVIEERIVGVEKRTRIGVIISAKKEEKNGENEKENGVGIGIGIGIGRREEVGVRIGDRGVSGRQEKGAEGDLESGTYCEFRPYTAIIMVRVIREISSKTVFSMNVFSINVLTNIVNNHLFYHIILHHTIRNNICATLHHTALHYLMYGTVLFFGHIEPVR